MQFLSLGDLFFISAATGTLLLVEVGSSDHCGRDLSRRPSGQCSHRRGRAPGACLSSPPTERGSSGQTTIDVMPAVAKDNAGTWALLPFPDRWYALLICDASRSCGAQHVAGRRIFPNSVISRLPLAVVGGEGLCLTCMPPRLSCMLAKACAGRDPGNTSTRVVQRQRLDMHPSIEE